MTWHRDLDLQRQRHLTGTCMPACGGGRCTHASNTGSAPFDDRRDPEHISRHGSIHSLVILLFSARNTSHGIPTFTTSPPRAHPSSTAIGIRPTRTRLMLCRPAGHASGLGCPPVGLLGCFWCLPRHMEWMGESSRSRPIRAYALHTSCGGRILRSNRTILLVSFGAALLLLR